MACDGRITEEELRQTVFPNYYRTVAENVAPFKDESSPVYRTGLRLVSCHTRVTPCYFRAKWLANPNAKPAIEYAREYVPVTRTWSNSTYEAALAGRPAAERRALVDELFDPYAHEVAQDLTKHGMDIVHAHIMIEKV